jgi:orotidine-5'-phosphate decarboxylase
MEVQLLRKELGPEPVLVTPGIRLSDDVTGDQKRVLTPAEAKNCGSNYIVMGRSITDKKDMTATVKSILAEISE